MATGNLLNYSSQKAQRVDRFHSYWLPEGCRHQRAVRHDAARPTLITSAMLVASGRRSVRCVRSPLSVGVWTQPFVHEKRGSGAVSVCLRGAASLARLDRQNCAPVGLRLCRYRSTSATFCSSLLQSVIFRHDSLCWIESVSVWPLH